MGRSLRLAGKRLIDVLAAGMALLALSPLLLFAALLVRLTSPGPVLFRQYRPGLNGRPFRLLKFRTMHIEQCDDSGIKQTTANDDRVTKFGRWLRRTSIDELPQLWNVLIGDMSLVGPRPHVEGMLAAGVQYKDLVPYYDLRLAMRPGLSGWAQANGLRGETGDADRSQARIDHDIAYIQNFSLWLDMKIVMMTIHREFLAGSGI